MWLSEQTGRVLGRWWLLGLLLAASTLLFGWIVPHAVSDVTAGRSLAPKILDEYYPTWSRGDAPRLYAALGARGRLAYRDYYLRLDFWFPMLTLSLCYASALSLAFPKGSRWAWVNILPLFMYLSDVAENLNHFGMAASYPDLSPFALAWGPWFSGAKYGSMTLLGVLALVGFGARLSGRFRAP